MEWKTGYQENGQKSRSGNAAVSKIESRSEALHMLKRTHLVRKKQAQGRKSGSQNP